LGTWETITDDFIQSRIHGQQNIDALAAEWSTRLPIPESTIRTYLTTNIHYTLDEECLEGMAAFFRTAAELQILPAYTLPIPQPVH
jgi:chorismate dehydratase